MIIFKHKKISAIQTLGEKLASRRAEQGISLEKAATKLQINPKYLRLIENNDYRQLPPEIYTNNFIKRYCLLLNLNDQLAISMFNKEKNIFFKTHQSDSPNKKQKSITGHKIFSKLIQPNTIKYTLIIILFLIIVFYIVNSINKIFLPPELLIKTPAENNVVVNIPTITINGVTEKEVELYINSKQVLYDDNGRFNVDLNLQKGLNIIKITAQKKHSEITTIYKQIIFEPQNIENNP